MERNTKQRDTIRKAFETANRPIGPAEVLEAARRHAPGLGIATVYRTIKGLLDEGWIVSVELPGESARYERSGKPHHHHFHCRSCKGVFEIEGCPGNLKQLCPKGFQLERHEVILYGLCEGCAKK